MNNLQNLRSPKQVMRLQRMGSFHQTRLSFMRVLLRRLRQENWQFDRPIWRIDKQGFGVATYRAIGPERTYTLIAFSHDLPAEKRSDRVIADAWDNTFTLFDGTPKEADLERLSKNVPLQEAGRITECELSLSRANRSVRLFDYVVNCLSQGKQPSIEEVNAVGYLMRTTAVYGSSKFGAADISVWTDRGEFSGSFQPELLTVWLIRAFTIDLVEHIAKQRNPQKAVKLAPQTKRLFGIGNSTGLGMAPFLINHPALIHSWIYAKETALARIRDLPQATIETQECFLKCLKAVIDGAKHWYVTDERQMEKIKILRQDLDKLYDYVQSSQMLMQSKPWEKIYQWGEKNMNLEAQEQLVSIIIEPHGDLIDTLSSIMCMNEKQFFKINGTMLISELKNIIKNNYHWAITTDFTKKESIARVWYVSAEKLEPRLGERFAEPIEDYEQPLCPARDINFAWQDLQSFPENLKTADFLLQHPEHRHIIRRVQLTNQLPYAEIQDNTISQQMLPLDLLRCKLSFFGATRFDPRSDRWLRITMFQGCPYPDELANSNPDDAFYPYGKEV